MNTEDMTNEKIAEYPKDFTNQDLLSATVEDIQNQPFSSRCKAECDELLRRLNEADVLRKENAELRKDKARLDFLDDGNYGIDPRNIPGVQMNGRRFHCLAGRGDWNTLREAIDAARLAKESEASHE